MKTKVFVDTNIVLDVLAKREPFYDAGKDLFALAEKEVIELYLSSITFVNIQYILRKQVGGPAMRQILQNLRLICLVAPTGAKEIDLALLSEMKDFEDGVQYYSAINVNASIIITRNIKDFKKSTIPVMDAAAYLDTLS